MGLKKWSSVKRNATRNTASHEVGVSKIPANGQRYYCLTVVLVFDLTPRTLIDEVDVLQFVSGSSASPHSHDH